MLWLNCVLLASTSATLIFAFEKPAYCRHKKHNRGQISTFLWRIKKQPPSYFFGTIHVPYTEVWEYVSPYAREAFARSNTVFLELDLNNPRTLRSLAMCQLLPLGDTLKAHLPQDVYSKLERRMTSIKANLLQWIQSNEPGHTVAYAEHIFKSVTGNWERKRPVWIMLMLNSLNSDGIQNRGVPVLDLYLAQEASSLSKPLGAIENAEEQCQPLNSLNKTHIVYILNQTLSRRNSDVFSTNYATTTKDLVEHYNCGSLDQKVFTRDSIQVPDLFRNDDKHSLSHSAIMSEINDYFINELILKRNLRMAERVVRLLEAHPDKSFFFAFGAGHFLGKESVVNLVRRAGYRIETVMPDDGTKKRIKKGKNRRQKGKTSRPKPPKIEPRFRPYSYQFPSRTTTSEPRRRNFNELWVRMNGYTPKPWQEIEINSASKQAKENPRNYFLVQYNHHYCSHCSSASGLTTMSFYHILYIILLSVYIIIFSTFF